MVINHHMRTVCERFPLVFRPGNSQRLKEVWVVGPMGRAVMVVVEIRSRNSHDGQLVPPPKAPLLMGRKNPVPKVPLSLTAPTFNMGTS